MSTDTIGWAGPLSAAEGVVGEHLAPTPLVRITLAGFEAGAHLKLETLQPTGSFKVRGALAGLSAAASRGHEVVTASAGNHGLGVAYAATRLGVRATVFVPETASPAKVEALRRFDIDLRLVGDTYDEAEATAMRTAEEAGSRFVSAYNDIDVIAGQATLVREVADQLEGAFRIVVPVGGGGLAAGTALAAPARVQVLGVETESSLAVSTAMARGAIVPVQVSPSLADGLVGNLAEDAMTPSILSAHGVRMVAVSETDLEAAVAELALRHGIVAEGSAAVGLAAARAGSIPADRPTVFVITGRNIAANRLVALLSR